MVGLSLLGGTASHGMSRNPGNGRWSFFAHADANVDAESAESKDVKDAKKGERKDAKDSKGAKKGEFEFDPLSLVPASMMDAQMKASLRELARFAGDIFHHL
jgi:hypothetical protein